ncbi:MAG TPA: hypothetical protein VE842_11440 [Pyrinomonadaceae bacterium]|jgi:hypothetical protein|nr:hypothetical protein [Pyrinomonadaceae bacterium]
MTRRTLIIATLMVACCATSIATWATTRARQNAAAGQQKQQHYQAQNAADIAAIEAYVKQMDAYARRNSRRGRLFADTADYNNGDAPPRWREFRNKSALRRAEAYSAATVWLDAAGALVVADFTLSSPSGDWAQYVTYYYRDDGTLAKVHSELRTFMGDLVVIRDRLYDPQGKMLREKTRYLDLNTRKPRKVEAGSFMDVPVELYAKTSDLPFYSLLKKQQ